MDGTRVYKTNSLRVNTASMLDDQRVTIHLHPKDATLYTLFCKHFDNFSSMLEFSGHLHPAPRPQPAVAGPCAGDDNAVGAGGTRHVGPLAGGPAVSGRATREHRRIAHVE